MRAKTKQNLRSSRFIQSRSIESNVDTFSLIQKSFSQRRQKISEVLPCPRCGSEQYKKLLLTKTEEIKGCTDCEY